MTKNLSYFLSICLLCLSFLGISANKATANSIPEQTTTQIYFFFMPGCPHCQNALKYIKGKYPNLVLIGRDISQPGNMKLMQQAVADYGIYGMIGTPLICLGNNYIMGWDETSPQNFDSYVQPYLGH